VTAFLAVSLLRDGLTTFFERIRDDLSLKFFLKVHHIQASALFFELLHARHHGYVHAAVLGPPFVKGRRADAQLAANVGGRKLGLNTFDRIHDLAVSEF
jgi:hypothetical protein